MRILDYYHGNVFKFSADFRRIFDCTKALLESDMVLEDEDYKQVRTIFKETFQLEPIEDMYSYLTLVKEERTKEIVVPTNLRAE